MKKKIYITGCVLAASLVSSVFVASVNAENAAKAGLDGIVCSPYEACIAKDLNLISVTPGIRLEGDSVGDQKRVATPSFAKEQGSDYIVVGRSITGSENPLEAYLKCKREFLN